ncbi:hypothetical protein ABMA28_001223 [Loxostege sticticalis]|uniref:Uncharacterized protein n=1 Tax=Loxostege sticticalis TaxID=481309 RepID=A0ABD0T502_LOXSC
MTREERQARDRRGGRARARRAPAHRGRRGRPVSTHGASGGAGRTARARVPLPPTRTTSYGRQSTSKVDIISRNSKKKMTRYEKQMKKFIGQQRMKSGSRRAAEISIEGHEMAIGAA